MALTRKLLKGMGLTEEQVETIIEAHMDTVDGLKDKLKDYEGDAEKLKVAEGKLAALEKDGGEDWKGKYEKEHSDFENYRQETESKNAAAEGERLFRAELAAMGITGKRSDQILKATDLKNWKIREGAYEDPEAVRTAIREDWGEFIPKTGTNGARVDTPPSNTTGKMTMEQIMAIGDRTARREAIAMNQELFKGGSK